MNIVSAQVVDTCTDCGVCCMKLGHIPFDYDSKEMDDLPDELLAEVRADFEATCAEEPYRKCIWFEDGCKHYDKRPIKCRRFPVGGEICLKLREEAGLNNG